MGKKFSSKTAIESLKLYMYLISNPVHDSTSYSYRDKAKRPKVKAKQKGCKKNSLPDITESVLDAGLNGLRIRDEFKIYDLVLVEAGKDVSDTTSEQL